jgi:hypothetical protein
MPATPGILVDPPKHNFASSHHSATKGFFDVEAIRSKAAKCGLRFNCKHLDIVVKLRCQGDDAVGQTSQVNIFLPALRPALPHVLNSQEHAPNFRQPSVDPNKRLSVQDARSVDGHPSLNQGHVPFQVEQTSAGQRPSQKCIILPL